MFKTVKVLKIGRNLKKSQHTYVNIGQNFKLWKNGRNPPWNKKVGSTVCINEPFLKLF